ncbi:LuxR C-terminal-related transcriptional regulator [Steroidobacter flavus]|uniref:LuxR C-terminal-related transcriptional regulator n=1 Tax=Steroidobacter flavus TaxID=1842136 RepID=A0ABV8SMJ0_9GAMM
MSSSSAFALTKIRPPRSRGHLVVRPTLERRLAQALASCRLTVLVAPAGFGKTAALTRQLELVPEGTAVAWIGADEDDDLHRFLACLFAALEAFDLPWRTAPDALVAAAVNSSRERRAVANELLNALAACDSPRGLIVIDDAERITDDEVFEFVDLLLERLPERWGFVIGSRNDPPLALARLRATDDLVEIRQAQLRFDRDEIVSLIAASGHAIAESDVTRLLARTRGWAAALRLTLSAIRSGEETTRPAPARALDRQVFDYLAAEVLDDMSVELRTFLMRCSVLPELTVARCSAISGNPRAAALLDEIERRDLFVTVRDGPELTLTLHDLFRECLNDRLRRELPDEVPNLLRAAADSEPDPIRRLSFLVSVGAWAEAESTLNDVASQLLANGVVEAVPRLIAQFPAERRKSSPMIALVRAWTAWWRWDWSQMIDDARDAVAGFSRLGDEPLRQRALIAEAIALTGKGAPAESAVKLAEISWDALDLDTRVVAFALHAWHALDSGDFGAVAGRYAKAVELLERLDGTQIWIHVFGRPLYVRLPGMREPLTRFVEAAMRRGIEAPSQMQTIATVMAAWLALWRGEREQAMELIVAAEADARWLGMPTNLKMFLNTFRAAAHAMTGDRNAALQAMRELLAYFDEDSHIRLGQSTSMLGHYLFYGIRIADAVGDAQSLREFAARMPPPERITNAPMLRAPLLTLPARLAAIDGRHAEACEHWSRALVDDTAIDIIGQAHEARVRYAGSLLALGRRAQAAVVLRPLFDEVAATGEIGGALLAGPAAISRLAAAPWRDELEPVQLAQLRDWAKRGQPASVVGNETDCQNRLTLREREILQRIAAGDTNKLIARAFDLSPHTVKRHVANILDKLGVTSRAEAVQTYRSQL